VRLLAVVASLALAVVVQSVLGFLLPSGRLLFDPLLLVALYCGLAWGETPGMLAGAAAGWVQDVAFGGRVLGLTALAHLLTGFVVGAAASRLLLTRPEARLLAVFSATLVDVWILEWLAAAFGVGLQPLSAWGLLQLCLANAVIGTAVYTGVERWRRARALR
jgi:rod shape-determining protein MreD